jgi:hypothetical protein
MSRENAPTIMLPVTGEYVSLSRLTPGTHQQQIESGRVRLESLTYKPR